jgi:SAM-dependent methyltransferase
MSSVAAHYEALLAPVYLWMAGGIDNALALGASDLAGFADRGGLAVDLGAGFGMHAIPLAHAGYRVLAIDSSPYLIEQLRSFSKGLDVEAVVSDLMQFPEHLPPNQKADLVLCMGDTLAHLPDETAVAELAQRVAVSLAPGGRFAATFRDYTTLPTGNARFIPVRSDANRIHTCFLEEQSDHVLVHDLLYEKQGDRWSMQVSNYSKLRLSPAAVCRTFQSVGLTASVVAGPRGMVRLTADA